MRMGARPPSSRATCSALVASPQSTRCDPQRNISPGRDMGFSGSGGAALAFCCTKRRFILRLGLGRRGPPLVCASHTTHPFAAVSGKIKLDRARPGAGRQLEKLRPQRPRSAMGRVAYSRSKRAKELTCPPLAAAATAIQRYARKHVIPDAVFNLPAAAGQGRHRISRCEWRDREHRDRCHLLGGLAARPAIAPTGDCPTLSAAQLPR
jgi:hypothetical protein